MAQLVDVPDLDHDGFRDLVAVSVFLGRTLSPNAASSSAEPERIYVDAISAKDGRLLWSWHEDDPAAFLAKVHPPVLWGRGPDGWPLLAVALGGGEPNAIMYSRVGPMRRRPPRVHNLVLSTGRELHSVDRLTDPAAADFDGDGLADLWGDVGGHLTAFRGEAPEAWRALGYFNTTDPTRGRSLGSATPAGADYSGDGIADALDASNVPNPLSDPGDGSNGERVAVCRSGKSGRLLWKAALEQDDSMEQVRLWSFPLPGGDLDGDGTPDVIVEKNWHMPPVAPSTRAATLPLEALSGRTGAHLWKAEPLPLGFVAHGYSRIESIEFRVIEPHSPPELLVQHDSPFAAPGSTASPAGLSTNPHLARVSGRDGQILWDIPFVGAGKPQPVLNSSVRFADLDGDGALDALLVLPSSRTPKQNPARLAAVPLRDGQAALVQLARDRFISSARHRRARPRFR